MLPITYAEFLVAMSLIFVRNAVSESESCGYASKENIEEGYWPWMVAIIKKNETGHDNLRCNGFLIDRRHVLTVAVCLFNDDELDEYTARIGKKNWEEGEEYEIACITTHPLHDWDYAYDDIAILTLGRDVDTPNYTPICLPEDNLRSKRLVGLRVTWPVWRIDRQDSRILKQFTDLSIISNKNCNKILFQQDENPTFPGGVSGDMLCTPMPSDQLKFPLSFGGAPVMYMDNENKWIAVGLSTHRLKRGRRITFVHLKLADYMDWILENTRYGKGECS